MFDALARAAARRPFASLAGWAVFVAVAFSLALGLVGPGLFGQLTSGEPSVPGEAQQGAAQLTRNSPEGDTLQLIISGVDPHSPLLARTLAAGRQQLTKVPGIASVVDPTMLPAGDPRAAALISRTGHGVLMTVTLRKGLSGEASTAAHDRVRTELVELGEQVQRVEPSAKAQQGSFGQLVTALQTQARVDMSKGESVALPLSLLVAVVVFGGFVAAGIPIIGAIASIAGGLLCLLGFAHGIDLDATVVNVVSVMGLGLCIDYGLLMVSRFRDELRALLAGDATGLRQPTRAEAVDAMTTTLRTAGRTVVFSGVTVAISIAGLMIVPSDLLRSVAAGGVSVVVVAVLVAVTLLPPLLVLCARWLVRPGALYHVPGVRAFVRKLGDVPPEQGAFSKLATHVQRAPGIVLVVVTAILLVLAAPVLSLNERTSVAQLLPVGNVNRSFFATLAEEYPATQPAPVQAVFAGSGPASMRAATAWAAQTSEISGVTTVDPPRSWAT